MAVLGLLAAAARDRPLLVTMDDVDRGDPPTAQVLAFVARRLRHLPVAVLLTADVTATIDGVAAHRLGLLNERESVAVLADRLPEWPCAPVAAALAAVGGGNPQALVDLADVLSPGQCRGRSRCPARRRPTARWVAPTGPGWTDCRPTPDGCCCSRHSTRTGSRPL
ncbi:hypothetical protein GCM10027614_03560 [Micromonospora vulcania]